MALVEQALSGLTGMQTGPSQGEEDQFKSYERFRNREQREYDNKGYIKGSRDV